MKRYQATFDLYRNGKDTGTHVGVIGDGKNHLKTRIGKLRMEYPESKGYEFRNLKTEEFEIDEKDLID